MAADLAPHYKKQHTKKYKLNYCIDCKIMCKSKVEHFKDMHPAEYQAQFCEWCHRLVPNLEQHHKVEHAKRLKKKLRKLKSSKATMEAAEEKKLKPLTSSKSTLEPLTTKAADVSETTKVAGAHGTTEQMQLNKKVVEISSRLSEQAEVIAKVLRQLQSLSTENEFLKSLLLPQYLAALPPLSSQNIHEWCNSAVPSEEELRTIEEAKRFFTQSLYICGCWTESIHVGGSTAKQTSVKGRFDMDVVIFLPTFDASKMVDYKKAYRDRSRHRIEWIRDTPAGSTFKFRNITVDVLFTGKYDGTELISYSNPNTRFYMASFVQAQVRYVLEETGQLEREVIRGIKKWIKVTHWAGLKPPSSYLIEVLAIHTRYAWRKQFKKEGKPHLAINDHNRYHFFHRVLKQLSQLQDAEVSSGHEDLPPHIHKPYIMDPTNAGNNLLDGLKSATFKLLASAASTAVDGGCSCSTCRS